jgi:hypothetical protein
MIAVLLFGPTAHADFVTYQQWQAYERAIRSAYIAGDIDATLETLVGGPAAQHFSSCLIASHATPDSISASLLEFAKERPELQEGDVHGALMIYLFAKCGYPPEK